MDNSPRRGINTTIQDISNIRMVNGLTLRGFLCEEAWKVNRLVKDNYLSFKQTWFTNKSEEKRAGKRKIKSEGDTTDGNSEPDDEQTEPVIERPKCCESPSSECLAGTLDSSSMMDDEIQVKDGSTGTTTFSSVASPSIETTSSPEGQALSDLA